MIFGGPFQPQLFYYSTEFKKVALKNVTSSIKLRIHVWIHVECLLDTQVVLIIDSLIKNYIVFNFIHFSMYPEVTMTLQVI